MLIRLPQRKKTSPLPRCNKGLKSATKLELKSHEGRRITKKNSNSLRSKKETLFLIYYDNKKKECATYFPRSFAFHGARQKKIFRFSAPVSERNVHFSCRKKENEGILGKI
nr:hypothetical protein [Candidatus Electrothrix aestuarii]